MTIKNWSVQKKYIFLQLTVVFIVLALASAFYLLNDFRIYRETIRTKLHSVASILGYNCTSALNFRDPGDAATTLQSVAAETQVTHAWILDASGGVFAAYRRQGQNLEPSPGAGGDFEKVQGTTLIQSRRILQDGEVIGSVVLRYDLDMYRKILLRNSLLAGLALLLSMGVAFVLAVFGQRALTRPILRLVTTIGRVAKTRDLSIRMLEERKDEIGILYRGFNNMMSEIHAREADRDRAAAALRESEEKYRTLVENAKDGIIILQDQRFVFANPSLLAMAGSSREELFGQPFVQYVAEEEVAKLENLYAKRMKGMDSESMYETVFKTKSGERIHAEVNAALIHFQGKPADLVIIRNINERKKAEAEIRKLNESLELRVVERTRELAAANERLVELDRMKSLFLASMSHELRTPLNSILGFTGLLLIGMSGPLSEEQTKQLTMVQNSGKHLLDLINEILDISKIESGKVDLTIESFPIAALANETLTAVGPLANAKGLTLAAEMPEGLILQSDRRRVKQVMMNLLGNAIKFSDRGCIRIEAGARGDDLAVSISDQGIGIRKEDLAKLFEAFRQVDMTSTKAYEGTGLGLYLSKKLLTLLRGSIAVESEHGRGSRFSFILPMKWKDGPHEESAHHRG